MIHFRIGKRSSGKSFRLMIQLIGKEFLFIEPTLRKLKARKNFIDNNGYCNYYGDLSKVKVSTIKQYLDGANSNVDIIVIDDFNEFIQSIFRGKEVYININPNDNAKFINVEMESEYKL